LRRDGLHKLTTRLAREYGTIVVEDLNVAGMLANRRLARRIADAGFAELRRQLAYKTGWNGGRLVVADRWYPSSKTCSGCGAVKTKLVLSERTYTCTTCGLVLDRDVNAARNLAALAVTVAGSGSETVNGRGADRKTRLGGLVAVKRQPGTAKAGNTGTVPPRGRTSNHELTYTS
jgi:putative transposase